MGIRDPRFSFIKRFTNSYCFLKEGAGLDIRDKAEAAFSHFFERAIGETPVGRVEFLSSKLFLEYVGEYSIWFSLFTLVSIVLVGSNLIRHLVGVLVIWLCIYYAASLKDGSTDILGATVATECES